MALDIPLSLMALNSLFDVPEYQAAYYYEPNKQRAGGKERAVSGATTAPQFAGALDTLAVDIVETPEEYKIIADTPGWDKRNIQVTVEKGHLNITGKQELGEASEAKVWRQERRKRHRFARSFQLPENVNTEAIGAAMENGVLKLTLPKLKQRQPTSFEVPILGEAPAAPKLEYATAPSSEHATENTAKPDAHPEAAPVQQDAPVQQNATHKDKAEEDGMVEDVAE